MAEEEDLAAGGLKRNQHKILKEVNADGSIFAGTLPTGKLRRYCHNQRTMLWMTLLWAGQYEWRTTNPDPSGIICPIEQRENLPE
ncbi:predicted protein [Sclerotinia sclerotiorum 1980 UF-70]|uniref:Uncharacterized protein n=1 Tax=Sclerotinia sclerotiorum (strain ATCC 18683 / 1980 / Ss-1) TaxID=665079 RepID=A7E743_SCLS1|nr:predicted protein [Sclerotinia sclerotiorum 1980 UF-70]EDN96195.1 predicted protein [Sclerotinia sclerotiorum 1980 UF-70]